MGWNGQRPCGSAVFVWFTQQLTVLVRVPCLPQLFSRFFRPSKRHAARWTIQWRKCCRQGKGRQGKERQGKGRQGKERQGKERQDTNQFGSPPCSHDHGSSAVANESRTRAWPCLLPRVDPLPASPSCAPSPEPLPAPGFRCHRPCNARNIGVVGVCEQGKQEGVLCALCFVCAVLAQKQQKSATAKCAQLLPLLFSLPLPLACTHTITQTHSIAHTITHTHTHHHTYMHTQSQPCQW